MSTCWTRVVGGVEEPGLLGRDAAGQLVYSPEGYMSAHLMRRGRVRFATQDVVGPSVLSNELLPMTAIRATAAGTRSMRLAPSCCIESPGMRGARSVSAIGFVLVLLLSSLGAEAQQPAKVARIGFLSLSSGPNPNMDVFRGLRELGWIEGQNISVESRWAAGRDDELPSMAADLVRRNVDIIVTSSTPAALAAKQATSKIPIVVTFVADPVGSGLVANLARPGGNITGISTLTPELVSKRMQLVKQVASSASRIAVLWDPAGLSERTTRNMREEAEVAGRALGVDLRFIEVRRPGDFERVFAAMAEARIGALVVSPTPMLFEARSQIVAHAEKSGLPTIYPWREAVETGGLASYATNFPDMYRRAAAYVDKILKGTKPADLPIEQPTHFQFVINLKTAKALNLSIPESLLQRADEVIR